MWLWESELRAVGFRRRSDRYWRCERRFGLPAWAHLSLFPWSECRLEGQPAEPRLIEFDTFHVTFALGGEHLHFYYHEVGDRHWEPAGHTSRCEIQRTGHEAEELRSQADGIAAQLLQSLGCTLLTRATDE